MCWVSGVGEAAVWLPGLAWFSVGIVVLDHVASWNICSDRAVTDLFYVKSHIFFLLQNVKEQMSHLEEKKYTRYQSLIWELPLWGYRLPAAFHVGRLSCQLLNLGLFFMKAAPIFVFSGVTLLLFVPLLLHAGEEVWRCLGCGDSIAAGQRLHKTVNEAWHISCFR